MSRPPALPQFCGLPSTWKIRAQARNRKLDSRSTGPARVRQLALTFGAITEPRRTGGSLETRRQVPGGRQRAAGATVAAATPTGPRRGSGWAFAIAVLAVLLLLGSLLSGLPAGRDDLRFGPPARAQLQQT